MFPLRSEYEKFVYGIGDLYPEVDSSTLRLYSTSSLTAILRGEIRLKNGLMIRVFEIISFGDGWIETYSYAIYHGDEKVRWYDPQPHPENPKLQETFPHHYHEEPNIKHNRIPAHGISFDSLNLSVLIRDCLEIERKIVNG